MSIKLLARDLYRFQKEVERLEKMFAEASFKERIRLEAQLRQAKAEKARLQRVLDGQLGR
jgi:hypothetical protein